MGKMMHVVMGNDFPAAVFDDLAKAEAYCDQQRLKGPHTESGICRIHWRTYDFYLNNERNA